MNKYLSILIFLFLIIFYQNNFADAQSLRTISQRLEFVGGTITLYDTTWEYIDVYFNKIRHEEYTDTTERWEYFTTIDSYSITLEFDTSGTYPAGDSDSAFAYVVELTPDSNTIVNDTTYLTPNFQTTGLDFEFENNYKYDFELSKAGSGYRIYIRKVGLNDTLQARYGAKK